MGLLVVGFEFEYAKTTDDTTAIAPSLTTGMGNVRASYRNGITAGRNGAEVRRTGQSRSRGVPGEAK